MKVMATNFAAVGRLIGLRTKDLNDLIGAIEEGLPFESVDRFRAATEMSLSEITDLLGIHPRTISRRRGKGRLDRAESERLLRMSDLYRQAKTLFEGDQAGARAWLKQPQRALGGQSPWEYARTEVGARRVEQLIGQLEHGVFS